jgi:hypothetical protein
MKLRETDIGVIAYSVFVKVLNPGLLKKPDLLRGNWFQRPNPDKLAVILAIDDCHNC